MMRNEKVMSLTRLAYCTCLWHLIIARRGDTPHGNALERLTQILHELKLGDLQERFDY